MVKQQIELGKDNDGRWHVQIPRTTKFKSILVLFCEACRKGRYPFFPFSTSPSQVQSKPIVSCCQIHNCKEFEGLKLITARLVKLEESGNW
jgi:hypothetical protein